MKNQQNFFLGLIFYSLSIGLVYYIPGFRHTLTLMLSSVENFSIGFVHFITYSVRDGLWMLALCTVLLVIWEMKWSAHSVILYLSAVVFAMLFERLQLVGWIPGVFDWNDILAIALGSIVPLFFTYKKIHYESVL